MTLKKAKNEEINAPVSGVFIALEHVDDQAFCSGVLGKGGAINPYEGTIYAPCDGMISVMADTHHAVGITSKAGVDILIHVGLNTVDLKGIYFTALVEEGQKVKRGDPLLQFDADGIKEAGYSIITPIVISNVDEFGELQIHFEEGMEVHTDQSLFTLKRE